MYIYIHEFEQTLGDGEGQESLACCGPWSCKELDTTKQLNNNGLCSPRTEFYVLFVHCFLMNASDIV